MKNGTPTYRSAILRRILFAAGIGILVASFILFPALVLIESCFDVSGCAGGSSLIDALAGMAGIGLATLLFGMVIYLPLTSLVILIGALFWRSIAARPARWAFGSAMLAFPVALLISDPGLFVAEGKDTFERPPDWAFIAFLATALLVPAAFFVRLSRPRG